MKNAAIIILSALCALLLLRGPRNISIHTPARSEEPTVGAAKESVPPARTTASPSPSAPHMLPASDRAEARLAAMKEVAWRYAKFFANARLSRPKTELLMDLLVDQKMAPFEADIQLASAGALSSDAQKRIDDAGHMDRKLIEELLGPEATRDLYSSSLDQTLSTESPDALQAIEAEEPIATEFKARFEQVLRSFNPQEGFDVVVNSRQEVTATIEQEFRASQAARTEAVISQLQGSISSKQADALRDWSRVEAD